MLLSPHDPALLFSKLRHAQLLSRINPLALTSNARVRSRWGKADDVVRHWTQIPAVAERVNFRTTGNAQESFKDFVCARFLNDGVSRDALSLGCGDGDRELDWARRNVFKSILGIDLSPDRINKATQAAAKAELPGKVRFQVADVNALALEQQLYDVVIFEHSLHHFTDVPGTLRKISSLLRPGGLLLVDEYVGPRRFQWHKAQLAFADAALLSLPESLRRYAHGGIKSRNMRAGELLMWLNDPSEAVESDRISTALEHTFKVIHHAGYGGTISHLIFHDIAHHFGDGNPEARLWAERILDAEDALLKAGLMSSDFACFVCAVK